MADQTVADDSGAEWTVDLSGDAGLLDEFLGTMRF